MNDQGFHSEFKATIVSKKQLATDFYNWLKGVQTSSALGYEWGMSAASWKHAFYLAKNEKTVDMHLSANQKDLKSRLVKVAQFDRAVEAIAALPSIEHLNEERAVFEILLNNGLELYRKDLTDGNMKVAGINWEVLG
jgi:hypothetical protein